MNYIKSSDPIDIKREINKRLYLICKAHKIDLENEDFSGSKQLCHAASRCGLFKYEDEFQTMSEGQSHEFYK